MAAKRKLTEAEKKAKDVDLEKVDNVSLSDLATKPATNFEEDTLDETIENPDAVKEEEAQKKVSKFDALKGRLNIYLWLFIAVVIVAVILIIVVNNLSADDDANRVTFEGSSLDQSSLDELLANDTNVGTVDQTLTVAANAIFNGKILVKDSLDVAGTINVGGALSLPGITVAGDSAFENVSVDNNLSISGNATINQSLSVEENLSVSGNISAGGTLSAGNISVDDISFSGDATFGRHIKTSGGAPGVSSGTAVGSGGTVSISGNDVSGTITINTGGSPPAGIFATISFTRAYGNTPRVQITPIGSTSAGLNYYASRNQNSFSVGTASAPSSAKTYVFDYLITE